MAEVANLVDEQTRRGLLDRSRQRPQSSTPAASIRAYKMIPYDRLRLPERGQPRTHFEELRIRNLADQIKDERERGGGVEGSGLLQAITVSPNPDGTYTVRIGGRRFRACGMVPLPVVPAYVDEAERSDLDWFDMAMAENDEREDLSPLEEAEAYERMMSEFGLSVAKIAQRRRKSTTVVRESLKRLQYDDDVLEMLEVNHQSTRAAREISRLPHGEFRRSLVEAVKQGRAYAWVEEQIRQHREKQEAARVRQQIEAESARELREHAAADPAAQPFAAVPPPPNAPSVPLLSTGDAQPTHAHAQRKTVTAPRRPYPVVQTELLHAVDQIWDVCTSVPPQGKSRKDTIEAAQRARKTLANLLHALGGEVE